MKKKRKMKKMIWYSTFLIIIAVSNIITFIVDDFILKPDDTTLSLIMIDVTPFP